MIPAGFPRFFLALMGLCFFGGIPHSPLSYGIICGLIGTMGIVMAVFNFMGGKHRGTLKILLFSLLGLIGVVSLFAGTPLQGTPGLMLIPALYTYFFLQFYGIKEFPTFPYILSHPDRFEDPRKRYKGHIWLEGLDKPSIPIELVATDPAEAAKIVEEQYGKGYHYTVSDEKDAR